MKNQIRAAVAVFFPRFITGFNLNAGHLMNLSALFFGLEIVNTSIRLVGEKKWPSNRGNDSR
jgi:hypothetical protein